jgi:hypothetical protein
VRWILDMIIFPRLLPLIALAALASCVTAAGPAAMERPDESAAFFSAALDHLAQDARGQVRVDPRPLRPGADLRRIRAEDLDPAATAVIRVRSDVLARRGIAVADAAADQRCTFSEGVEAPPGRVLPDSVRREAAECAARPAYTTFVLGTPERSTGNGYPPGTWRVGVHAMQKSGFAVWDLYLHPTTGSGWEVVAAERRFGMSS